VFGTDFPYASEKVSKTFTTNLDKYRDLAPETLEAINRGASALIPRVKELTVIKES